VHVVGGAAATPCRFGPKDRFPLKNSSTESHWAPLEPTKVLLACRPHADGVVISTCTGLSTKGGPAVHARHNCRSCSPAIEKGDVGLGAKNGREVAMEKFTVPLLFSCHGVCQKKGEKKSVLDGVRTK
jgi:hypothetical protein